METLGQHRFEAHHDAELIDALEPDQLTAHLSVALPRMPLTRTMRFWLGALRIFVFVIAALAIWTCFENRERGPSLPDKYLSLPSVVQTVLA